jgi:Undecaprenyl-phosphate galactose phosphotransferase WbaP
VQGSLGTKVERPVTVPAEPLSRDVTLLARWAKFNSRKLVPFVLISSDLLLALALWQAAVVLQGVWGRGPLSWVALTSIVPTLVIWVGLRAVLGLYPGYGMGHTEELRRQTFALFATLAITAVLAFASQISDSLSRVLLLAWSVGLLVFVPVVRYFVKRAMMKIGFWGKPVVILGARGPGARVLRVLRREWHLGFKPVAVFDNRVAPTGGTLESVPYGGKLTDAIALARKNGVDTAIFAMPYTRRHHLAKFVDLVKGTFRHVVVIPDLGSITNSAVVARDLAGTFGVEIKYNLLDPWAQRAKRLLDVGATVIGGVLILPLLLMLSLLVWVESGRPVFYADKRMGRDGKLFSCVKFRTMVPDAEAMLQRLLAENDRAREEYAKYHKLRDDPRVTRVGRFLRKTSLDEWPQIWNVLRGEMSLVGPRPYLPRESADIGTTQSEILRVTPGITGPWQVADATTPLSARGSRWTRAKSAIGPCGSTSCSWLAPSTASYSAATPTKASRGPTNFRRAPTGADRPRSVCSGRYLGRAGTRETGGVVVGMTLLGGAAVLASHVAMATPRRSRSSRELIPISPGADVRPGLRGARDFAGCRRDYRLRCHRATPTIRSLSSRKVFGGEV